MTSMHIHTQSYLISTFKRERAKDILLPVNQLHLILINLGLAIPMHEITEVDSRFMIGTMLGCTRLCIVYNVSDFFKMYQFPLSIFHWRGGNGSITPFQAQEKRQHLCILLVTKNNHQLQKDIIWTQKFKPDSKTHKKR